MKTVQKCLARDGLSLEMFRALAENDDTGTAEYNMAQAIARTF